MKLGPARLNLIVLLAVGLTLMCPVIVVQLLLNVCMLLCGRMPNAAPRLCLRKLRKNVLRLGNSRPPYEQLA